jgi:hypothetical protein
VVRKSSQFATLAGLVERLVTDSRQILSVSGTKAETSLYSQFATFLGDALGATRRNILVVQQSNAEGMGVPDYRIQVDHQLQGWIELKAVLKKNLTALRADQKDHDSRQHERFKSGLDNLIYTTGWQWRLYQHGKQVGRDVVLGPDYLFDPTSLPVTVDES